MYTDIHDYDPERRVSDKFLFSNEYVMSNKRFDDIHEWLREWGCHSPTRESLRELINAIKSLLMLRRLQGNTFITDVSLGTLELKAILSPETRDTHESKMFLDFSNSGYYTELLLLRESGIVWGTRGTIFVSPRKIKDYFLNTDEKALDRLEKYAFKHIDEVMRIISGRIAQDGHVMELLRAFYTERDHE